MREISAPHLFGIVIDGLNQNEQEPISTLAQRFTSFRHCALRLEVARWRDGVSKFLSWGGLGGVGGGFGTLWVWVELLAW